MGQYKRFLRLLGAAAVGAAVIIWTQQSWEAVTPNWEAITDNWED